MNILRNERFEKGKKYCFRLLSLRSRSEYEIASGLKKKGYDLHEIGAIVDFLRNEGLVNDLEFAVEWIDFRQRTSPRSIKMLKEELVRKGLNPGVIEKAMKERAGLLDEKEIAADLLKEKLKREGMAADTCKLKGKLFRFLASKGFDEDMALDLVNEFIEKQDEYDG